jgi:hypothetical protein
MASHSQLVENILDLPWAGTTDEFCKSWCRFVCALVSARTEWAANVLNRIVKALRWRSDWLPLQPPNQPAPSADATNSSQTPAQPTRRLLYTRTHLLLRAVLALIPTSVSTLNQLLVKHFPHRREGKREQATFARNILFITQYEGQVAETVWRVVADRAIGLDVEIQIELDELEEEGGGEGSDIGEEKSSAASDLDPFDRAIDDDDSSEGSDSGDEGGTGFDDLSDEDIEDVDGDGTGGLLQDGEEERKDRKVRELVDKLDALMKVCLEHLEKMGTVKGKKTGASELVLDPRSTWLNDFLGTAAPSSGNVTPTSERPQSFSVKTEELTRTSPEVDEEFEATKDALFHNLLQLFSRSILPTFKCRHVQFLLFWYCSLETDFADYFLGFLIHKAIYAKSGVGGFDDDSMDRSSGQRERAEPLVLRQASASYVASFVSRAHYITPTYTRTVVLNLCSYLEAHLEAYSNAITLANSIGLANIADERTRRLAVAPPGSEEHAIWYAVAQAVFYIFCFRWQDLKIGGAGPGVASTSTGAGPGGAASSSTPRKVSKAASITSSNERDADEYEVDGGLMIGSLSSTGSSSYAMPSSVHRGQPFSLASHKANADAKAREAPGLGPSSFSSSLSSAQDPALGEIQLDAPSNIDTEPTGVPAGSAGGSGTGTGTSSWSQGLSILQRAILSPLNPLQHCSGTVVRQFAAVAQHVGFLYCWSLIEANNRRSAGIGVSSDSQAHGGTNAVAANSRDTRGVASTPHNATGGTAGAAGTRAFLAKDLEGFFPFDPYRLSSTAERFVAPLYREWRDVAPVGLGGDEEEEEEEEGSDEESDDEESTSGGEEDEEEEEDSLTSESQEHNSHNRLALSASRTGLQIPGSGKRPHHHRRRQRSSRGRDGAEDSSLLSASDASRNDEEDGQGDGAGIEEGLEAMSVSAS